MTYILEGDEGATNLMILQEDPRCGAEDIVEGEEDNPVLTALTRL